MEVTDKGRQDLSWWKQNVVGSSLQIKTANPDFTLTTNVSEIGWGGGRGRAVLSDDKVQGEWVIQEEDLHINIKELLAVRYGLKYLA